MRGKNIQLLIGIGIISIFILINSLRLSKNEKKINETDLSTIGRVVDNDFTGKVYGIKYSYYVDSKIYTGVKQTNEAKNFMSNFYMVKYLKDNPEISEIYLNNRIYDTLQILNSGFKLEKSRHSN
jgi:hypothetical protein